MKAIVVNATLIRAVVIAVLMGASALSAAMLTPRTRLVETAGAIDLEKQIPERFGDWELDGRGGAFVINPQQQDLINQLYSQTLSRNYRNSRGDRVMLSIAYGEDQRDSMQVHRPEICYPAQGFRLDSRRADVVMVKDQELPVVRLETVLGNSRYEPVTYWIVLAGSVVNSGTQKKLAELSYGLRGVIPDGLLFRVSSINRDSRAAFDLQDAFLADLIHSLPPESRQRLSGLK